MAGIPPYIEGSKAPGLASRATRGADGRSAAAAAAIVPMPSAHRPWQDRRSWRRDEADTRPCLLR